MKMDENIELTIVTWFRNSVTTLGNELLVKVLQSIEKVIPDEIVHEKIAIDDHSTDDTSHFFEKFEWKVIRNTGRGIASAFNLAMSLAKTPLVLCVEHDIILSKCWYDTISKYISLLMKCRKIVALQGVNVFVARSKAVGNLEYLKQLIHLQYGEVLPNINSTFFNRDLVNRYLLPVPTKLTYGAVDGYLYIKAVKRGLKWYIIPSAKTIHLWIHIGVREYINKMRIYAKMISNMYPYLGRELGMIYPLTKRQIRNKTRKHIDMLRSLIVNSINSIPLHVASIITYSLHNLHALRLRLP